MSTKRLAWGNCVLADSARLDGIVCATVGKVGAVGIDWLYPDLCRLHPVSRGIDLS